MSVVLIDDVADGLTFRVNIWHWAAIVQALERLAVVPDDRIEELRNSYLGDGLTREQARLAADAIETKVLPALTGDARLLLDGTTTFEPDDGRIHEGDDWWLNFSTDRSVLERFVVFLRSTNGFGISR